MKVRSFISLKVEKSFQKKKKNTPKETMSTDSSQFEVVPANASVLDNDVSSHMSMLYQDIVRNPELFWEMLRDFHESSDKKFK